MLAVRERLVSLVRGASSPSARSGPLRAGLDARGASPVGWEGARSLPESQT